MRGPHEAGHPGLRIALVQRSRQLQPAIAALGRIGRTPRAGMLRIDLVVVAVIGARGEHRPAPQSELPTGKTGHVTHPPAQTGAEHPAPVLQPAQRHGVTQRQLQPQLLLATCIGPQMHLQPGPDLEQRLEPRHARPDARGGAAHRWRQPHAHIQLDAIGVPQIRPDAAAIHPQMRRAIDKHREGQQVLPLPGRPPIIRQRDARQPGTHLPDRQAMPMRERTCLAISSGGIGIRRPAWHSQTGQRQTQCPPGRGCTGNRESVGCTSAPRRHGSTMRRDRKQGHERKKSGARHRRP